jgi:hypothetical protein
VAVIIEWNAPPSLPLAVVLESTILLGVVGSVTEMIYILASLPLNEARPP